jgi:hypothetical protein
MTSVGSGSGRVQRARDLAFVAPKVLAPFPAIKTTVKSPRPLTAHEPLTGRSQS